MTIETRMLEWFPFPGCECGCCQGKCGCALPCGNPRPQEEKDRWRELRASLLAHDFERRKESLHEVLAQYRSQKPKVS